MFLYTFRYITHNDNGSFDTTRKVKADGLENAVAKFEEDFKEWGEEVPKWGIIEMYGIEDKKSGW